MRALVRSFAIVWQQRDFRRVFLSQAISATGDRIALVALAIFVTQSGSPAQLGAVLGSQAAALVLFLLVGGVWADRLPRHRIMMATDVVRAVLHALVAILIVVGHLALPMLIAAEVMFGAAQAFFQPAFTGLIPQTVPEDLVQEATAANSLMETIAKFVGPVIATILVLTVGAAAAFAVDAATFAVSAALLAKLRPRPRGAPPQERASLRVEMVDGYREVRRRPWVFVTILMFSIHLLVAMGPYAVLGPATAARRYGDVALWGWVVAAVGVGLAVGAAAAIRWRPLHPLRAGLIAVVPFGALLLSFAVGLSLACVLLFGVTAGAGVALFGVWWETALAERIPPAALSRVTSIDWMASSALLPIGYVAVGYLAARFGAASVMAIGGALAMVLPLAALSPRQTRTLSNSVASRRARPLPDAA